MHRGRIKGVAFREFVRWYVGEYGISKVRSVVDASPLLNPTSEAFGILPSTWYEPALVHQLLDAMVGPASFPEQDEMARAGAYAVMSATLNGIYKRLFSMIATPTLYARFAPKLWSSYYEDGAFHVEIDGNNAVATIREWPAHHRFMCLLNRWAATAIYEAMGQTSVTTERTHCVAEGNESCRFRTSWT